MRFAEARLLNAGAPLEVGRIDEMAVALDVTVLAADDEDDRLLLERVRDAAAASSPRVEQAALAELAALAVDVDPDAAAVDEVELVLGVVVVRESLVAGREDERVHAERRDAERLAGSCGSRARRRARRATRTRASSRAPPGRRELVESSRRPRSAESCSSSSGVKREPNSSSMSARCVFRAALILRQAGVRQARRR